MVRNTWQIDPEGRFAGNGYYKERNLARNRSDRPYLTLPDRWGSPESRISNTRVPFIFDEGTLNNR